MGQCLKCNFPLKEGAIACPQCGDVIIAPDVTHGTVDQVGGEISKTVEFSGTVDRSGEPAPAVQPGTAGVSPASDHKTINFAAEQTALPGTAGVSPASDHKTINFAAEQTLDISQQTVDFSASDYAARFARRKISGDVDDIRETDFEPGTGPAGDGAAGTGTVDATGPGSIAGFSHSGEEEEEEEAVMELDEEFDDGELHTTLNATGDEGHATHVATTPAALSDDQMTYVVSPDSHFLKEHSDDVGTVHIPATKVGENVGERTIAYGSTDMGPGTVEAGSSGTEGRLKRLWDGVAGSSADPMHSLQAPGLQASDSIFERVATRRVADANVRGDFEADYQIINKLGEGAMGIVFSAKQTTVDRVVAIKMAKPSFQQNEESRRRFLYEAQITADLDHSNIVPIHELGANESGMLFYSMKLVQGTGWNAAIRRKTRDQNLEIFMKVADAIAFAHSKGVIHRDLKPENTMLGRFGEVFVTDWGTAINLTKDTTRLAVPASQGDKFITVEDGRKFRRGDAIALVDDDEVYDQRLVASIDDIDPNRIYLRKKLTHSYQLSPKLRVMKVITMAGTPCYMAPEMAGHDLPKIGRQSDIYVLGAILYDIVMGRAPHTGKSMSECFRAAIDNNVVVQGNDDPLLTIAYKAMETQPEERFQSVEEMQDAVREYRRHAESIALTNRSDELLEQATAKGDYAMYSRTLFGYRDAIDLWPQNQTATLGLEKARLAFGQAAYKKGDYDLVLQTVDRGVQAEDALYLQAVSAKQKAEGREKSLKVLKRVIAAVVLCAVTVLSGLLVFAFGLANRNKQLAITAQAAEKTARDSEQNAKELAFKNAELATSEAKQKNAAELAALKAREAEMDARTAEMDARDAEELAKGLAATNAELAKSEGKEKVKAEKAATEARIAEGEARLAENLANVRAAQIQLGEYSSSLALAKSQFESYDVTQGQESLQKLKNLPLDVFAKEAQPNFYSWGWRRINLLSNSDLPTAKLDREVTAADCSAKSGRTVIGTADGLIQVLQRTDGGLVKQRSYTERGARINTLAVSPAGDECVYGYTRGEESGLMRWDLDAPLPQAVVAGQKRQFQRLAYTADSSQVLAGINSGIWIWDRGAEWFSQKSPKRRIDSIRGDLLNLQDISSTQIFVTSKFQNQVSLHVLDYVSGVAKELKLPSKVAADLSSAAHGLVDNAVILGLSNNRLLAGKLDLEAGTIEDLIELEDKHRAAVSQIVADGSGKIITLSASEPVAHVWKYADKAWLYDSYLTGTPKNLAEVGVLGAGQVLGVDELGTAILWDVERQKQRSRLLRQADGVAETYASSVHDVFAGTSAGEALAIDENGVVDRWSLVDGATQKIDAARWSYIGHTPGAELVDSAVDLERGVVITAARLRYAEKKYLIDAAQAWEFCIWDAATGAMQRRWTAANRPVAGEKGFETVEQRISLIDHGRQILFSSDRETRLVDLASGKDSLLKADFGTFFAVPHPQNSSLLMLVKRSGAVRLFDLRQASSWQNLALQEFSLAGSSEIPLRGVWSSDGRRFYLAFSAGGLAAFDWNSAQLKLTWSNRKLDGDPQFDDLRKALQVKSGRLQSHLDMDLMVEDAPAGEVVHIAARNREQNGFTKLLSLQFARTGSDPRVLVEREESDVRWLQVQDGKVKLSNRLHDSLVLDVRRVRSRQSVNGQVFVSTDSAQVFGLEEGKQRVISYGRAPLVMATGTQTGRIFVLLEDGALWRFAASDVQPWQRLTYSALGATQIKLSPDASKLLISGPSGAKIVAAETGETLQRLESVSAANWDPGQAARLAIAHVDGSLALWTDGHMAPLEGKADLADGQIVDVQFFVESWSDEQTPSRQLLLIHTEDKSKSALNGKLQFVTLDGTPVLRAGAANEVQKVEVKWMPPGTRIKASPTEGIIVSGSPNGTVTVWYATPAYEKYPRQLFDLEGHRGGKISCVAFSSDGKTIITADDRQRLFAWLSSDPLAEGK